MSSVPTIISNSQGLETKTYVEERKIIAEEYLVINDLEDFANELKNSSLVPCTICPEKGVVCPNPTIQNKRIEMTFKAYFANSAESDDWVHSSMHKNIKEILLMLNQKKAFGNINSLLSHINQKGKLKELLNTFDNVSLQSLSAVILRKAASFDDRSRSKVIQLLIDRKISFKQENQDHQICAYYTLKNNENKIDYELLATLIQNGLNTSYIVDREGLIQQLFEDFYSSRNVTATLFKTLIFGTLANGANPLLGYWCKSQVWKDGQTSLPHLARERFSLYSYLYFCLAQSPTPSNSNDMKIIMENFFMFSEFGAGLMKKSKRFPTIATGDWLSADLRSCKKFLEEEGVVSSVANFEKDITESEIFLLGRNVHDKKPVLIYSLSHLENILSGHSKEVEIRYIDIIAKYVFEAEDEDLPQGLKALFSKYKGQFDKGKRLDLNSQQNFNKFIKKVQNAPLEGQELAIPENQDRHRNDFLYKFDKIKNPFDTRYIYECIQAFERWFSSHDRITEILSHIANRDAEQEFFFIITRFIETIGKNEFLKFISTQNSRFFKTCGRLLLFYSVRNLNIELFRTLMHESVKQLYVENNLSDLTLGKTRNSLFVELLECNEDTKAEKELNEIWNVLCSNTHWNAEHEHHTSLLPYVMGQPKQLQRAMDLIQNGISPFCSRTGEIFENYLKNHYSHNEPSLDIRRLFQQLCDYGFGLSSIESRFHLGSEFSRIFSLKINGQSVFDFARNPIYMRARLRRREVLYGINVENQHIPSSRTADYAYTTITTVEKLERVLNGQEQDIYLIPHFETLCQNVLQADDSLIQPSIKFLFIRKLKESIILIETLKSLGFSEQISSLIEGYVLNDNNPTLHKPSDTTLNYTISYPVVKNLLKIRKSTSYPEKVQYSFGAKLAESIAYIKALEQYPTRLIEIIFSYCSDEMWYKEAPFFMPYISSLTQCSMPAEQIPLMFDSNELDRPSNRNLSRRLTYAITRRDFTLALHSSYRYQNSIGHGHASSYFQRAWFGRDSIFASVLSKTDTNNDASNEMSILLEHGLLARAVVEQHEGTALSATVVTQRNQYLKMLLNAGFHPDAKGDPYEYGYPPAHRSGPSRPIILALLMSNLEAVEMLVDAGADLSPKDSSESHLSQYAEQGKCLNEFWALMKRKNKKMVLLKPGNILSRFNEFISLKNMTEEIQTDLFLELIAEGLLNKHDEITHDGIVREIISLGKVNLLEILHKSGVDIKSLHNIDTFCITPLGWALQNGKIACASFLLDIGCPLHDIGTFAKPLIERAKEGKCEKEFLELLHTKGRTLPAIATIDYRRNTWWSSNNSSKQITLSYLLLETDFLKYAEEHVRNEFVFDILDHCKSLVSVLVQAYPNINSCMSRQDISPLQHVLLKRDFKSAELLIAAKGSIKGIRDERLIDLMFEVVKSRNSEALGILISAGIDVNSKIEVCRNDIEEVELKIPLCYALEQNDIPSAKLLILAGSHLYFDMRLRQYISSYDPYMRTTMLYSFTPPVSISMYECAERGKCTDAYLELVGLSNRNFIADEPIKHDQANTNCDRNSIFTSFQRLSKAESQVLANNSYERAMQFVRQFQMISERNKNKYIPLNQRFVAPQFHNTSSSLRNNSMEHKRKSESTATLTASSNEQKRKSERIATPAVSSNSPASKQAVVSSSANPNPSPNSSSKSNANSSSNVKASSARSLVAFQRHINRRDNAAHNRMIANSYLKIHSSNAGSQSPSSSLSGSSTVTTPSSHRPSSAPKPSKTKAVTPASRPASSVVNKKPVPAASRPASSVASSVASKKPAPTANRPASAVVTKKPTTVSNKSSSAPSTPAAGTPTAPATATSTGTTALTTKVKKTVKTNRRVVTLN